MKRVDAHQHFWRLSRGDYGWLTPELGPIHRDFGLADLKPHLAAGRIDRTILVQAAPTEAETVFMLEVAAADPVVAGVVGWVDFDAPDVVDRIARFAENPLLVGLRPMIQDIPDPRWMLAPHVGRALDAMERENLVFDALVKPVHLAPLATLIADHPGLTTVLDHLGKPAIADGESAFAPWAAAIDRLTGFPLLGAKLSGVLTEPAPGRHGEAPRYLAHALAAFGPDRLLFGSDWPVLTLAAGYADWLAMAEATLAGLAPAERQAFMGGNAARVYLGKGRGRC